MALAGQGVEHPPGHRRGNGRSTSPWSSSSSAWRPTTDGRLRLGYRVETHALGRPVPDLGLRVREVGRGRGRARRRRAHRPGRSGRRLLSRRRCRAYRRRARGTPRRDRECISREELREIMPRGGARNAVDCAMWELEAKRAGTAARGARRNRSAEAAGHHLHARRRRARKRWPKARGATPTRRRSRSS